MLMQAEFVKVEEPNLPKFLILDCISARLKDVGAIYAVHLVGSRPPASALPTHAGGVLRRTSSKVRPHLYTGYTFYLIT